MNRFSAAVAEWSTGRFWQWRAALLLLLAWNGVRVLRDPDLAGLFGGITFGVHELGHLLWAPFGEFMAVAGGSLNQLLVPVGAGALMLYYGDYFGLAAAGAWLSSSLSGLSTYIGDARALELDLVSMGQDSVHDWNYLLGQLGILKYDTSIASDVHKLGWVVLAVSVGFGGWICWVMRAGDGKPLS